MCAGHRFPERWGGCDGCNICWSRYWWPECAVTEFQCLNIRRVQVRDRVVYSTWKGDHYSYGVVKLKPFSSGAERPWDSWWSCWTVCLLVESNCFDEGSRASISWSGTRPLLEGHLSHFSLKQNPTAKPRSIHIRDLSNLVRISRTECSPKLRIFSSPIFVVWIV